MSKLKMHIVVRDDISVEAVIVAVAHISLGTYLNFESDEIMQRWQKTSFVKIIHKANADQFLSCRKLGPHRVFIESILNNMEVGIGFKPMEQDHPLFKEIPLWKVD